MVGNVVLTGGGSLFEGMPERITSELTGSLPSAFKVRGRGRAADDRQHNIQSLTVYYESVQGVGCL